MKTNSFDFLIGLEVAADHPITCANPDKTFKIFDVKVERGNIYIRGENTIWFHSGLIKRI